MSTRKTIRIIILVTFLALMLGSGLRLIAAEGSLETGLLAQAASDPLIGQPFPVDSGPGDQTNPAVAYNSQRQEVFVAYVVGGGGLVTVARLSNIGTVIFNDPPVIYVFTGDSPAVAYNSAADEYLLVWRDGAAITGARFDGEGRGIGSVFTISGPAIGVAHPAVAFNEHGSYEDFLVVWEAAYWVVPTGTAKLVAAQRVAGTSGAGTGGGDNIDGNFDVANTNEWNTEPDLAYNLNRNEFLVVYTRDSSLGADPNSLDVYGTRVTGFGQVLTEHAIDNAGMGQFEPSVAAYRLNHATPYLVVYTDSGDPQGSVWGFLVDGDGNPSGGVLSVAAAYGKPEGEPDVASSESLGGYTVVWSQFDVDWDVYARRVDDAGNVEPAFNVSVYGLVVAGCNEQVPVVAGGSPVAMTVWQDSCFGAGGWDVVGRLLGYRVFLPLALR